MKTQIFNSDPSAICQQDIDRCAQIIKDGGLVAFPTETVYGLGADATDAKAASKIYAAKGRPSDNPLIIHVANPADAERYAYTDELYKKLSATVNRLMTDEKINVSDTAIVSSARQHAQLTRTQDYIELAISGLSGGFSQDAVSSDIERALGAISEHDSREVSEAVVADIFSKFCVGK